MKTQEPESITPKGEYQKSLKENYLVFKDMRGEENYELHMILENQIDGFLPMEIRSIDGREDIYFRVNSMQPISVIYKNKEMRLEDVKTVLTGLTKALMALQEYMLEEDHIVLFPEYFFMHMESRKIKLLFHPFYEGDIREGIKEFADYLIARIDHTDQNAVMMGYQFYRTVREDNFVIDDIIRLYCDTRFQDKGQNLVPDRRQEFSEDELWEDKKWDKRSEKEEEKVSADEEKNEVKEINKVKLGIFSILALVSGLLIAFGIGSYRPAQMGKIILIFIMLVSVFEVIREFMTAASFFSKKSSPDTENALDSDPGVRTESRNHYDDIFAEDMTSEQPQKKDHEEELSIEEPENYGKTVFLSQNDKLAENILIEKKKGKEIMHPIQDFPYTIGKVKGCVDLALNDISVSRMHARITEEDGQVYVQDCNSTNGTYVNGVMLDKYEKILIEADDEIRIGRVSLLYQ